MLLFYIFFMSRGRRAAQYSTQEKEAVMDCGTMLFFSYIALHSVLFLVSPSTWFAFWLLVENENTVDISMQNHNMKERCHTWSIKSAYTTEHKVRIFNLFTSFRKTTGTSYHWNTTICSIWLKLANCLWGRAERKSQTEMTQTSLSLWNLANIKITTWCLFPKKQAVNKK